MLLNENFGDYVSSIERIVMKSMFFNESCFSILRRIHSWELWCQQRNIHSTMFEAVLCSGPSNHPARSRGRGHWHSSHHCRPFRKLQKHPGEVQQAIIVVLIVYYGFVLCFSICLSLKLFCSSNKRNFIWFLNKHIDGCFLFAPHRVHNAGSRFMDTQCSVRFVNRDIDVERSKNRSLSIELFLKHGAMMEEILQTTCDCWNKSLCIV